jgi:transcriptional regulator with XRE-family HTH domain
MSAPRLQAESRAYFRALGKHITELRKEIGMTQAELARALGVSQQTVFAYELGDRRVSVLMLVKLARIFDTSVEELSGLKISEAEQNRAALRQEDHRHFVGARCRPSIGCVRRIVISRHIAPALAAGAFHLWFIVVRLDSMRLYP